MHSKRIAFLAFAIVFSSAVFAEQIQYKYGNYHFTYDDPSLDIENIGESFMALRGVFTGICGFNPDPDKYPARVRILADREAYNEYLQTRIGETRNQYVFLKYGKPELSELVIFPAAGTGFASFSGPSLNRQLFLQYLYSYILEPPLWLRDGLQAWVENISVVNGAVVKNNYSPWLETAKNYAADPEHRLSVEDILGAETGSYEAARLYPLSWAFIAFLLQTERAGYQRFLYESFVLLENDSGYNRNSQKENTALLLDRFQRNTRFVGADESFLSWLGEQRTFSELLSGGVEQYNKGKFRTAMKDLQRAWELQPSDPLPVYYLGLCAYGAGMYKESSDWYLRALDNGADAATVHWALALSSHALRDYRQARTYLDKAVLLSPERYSDKAASLLSSMPQ